MHERHRRLTFGLIALACFAAVAWADRATGAEVSVLALYLVPVAIASLGANLWTGLGFAAASAASIFLTRNSSDLFGHRPGLLLWNSVMAGTTLLVAALGMYGVKLMILELLDDPRPRTWR